MIRSWRFITKRTLLVWRRRWLLSTKLVFIIDALQNGWKFGNQQKSSHHGCRASSDVDDHHDDNHSCMRSYKSGWDSMSTSNLHQRGTNPKCEDHSLRGKLMLWRCPSMGTSSRGVSCLTQGNKVLGSLGTSGNVVHYTICPIDGMNFFTKTANTVNAWGALILLLIITTQQKRSLYDFIWLFFLYNSCIPDFHI